VARNAHLNFNVFGVRAAEYVEDMYGETESPLHQGSVPIGSSLPGPSQTPK